MDAKKIKLTLHTLGLCLLVILPFAAYFTGVYSNKEEAQSPQPEIADLIARKDYARAYEILSSSPSADSTDLSRQHQRAWQLAICQRYLGHREAAYQQLERLPDTLPELEDYRQLWMARLLDQLDREEDAQAAYQAFIERAQHAALIDSAYLYLAEQARQAQDYQTALAHYQQIIEHTPSRTPEMLYRMARVNDLRKYYKTARKIRWRLLRDYPGHYRADDAVDLLGKPNNAAEAYTFAEIYRRHKRYDKAIGAAKRFLATYKKDRRRSDVHYLLGRSYYGARKYDKAETVFKQLHSKYKRPSALYQLAGTQVRLNNDREAIDTYLRFVRLYPYHGLADDALWRAAKAAERHSLFARAEELYDQLARKYPTGKYRDEARWSAGFMRYCQGEYPRALESFLKVSRVAREPHIVDQALFWAGKTAQHLKLDDQAETHFQKAANHFPRSYYSARAVSRGFLPASGPAKRRPQMIAAPRLDVELLEGAQFLRRAESLSQLGLSDLAGWEFSQVEKLNRKNLSALRRLRDRCEELGLLDQALTLTVRLFVKAEEKDELYRLYPNYYWEQIRIAARESKIDPHLVVSVIRQESFFKKNAVSHAGAIGLMQIMPTTGKNIASEIGLKPFARHQLFDPHISIRMGSYFLSNQVKAFTQPDSAKAFELGLAAYNAGPHKARQWIERFSFDDPDTFVERIPYKETRLYVKKVLKNYAIYKALSSQV